MPISTWYRHRHTFAYTSTFPPPSNRLWAPVFKRKWLSTLPLHLLSRSQHRDGEASPTSTPTAQPMNGTERLCMGINDTSAGWISTFDTPYQLNTDHDITGLCATFGGAVDWMWTQLKPTAQSTTNFGNTMWFTPAMPGAGDWSFGRSSEHSMVSLLCSVFCVLCSVLYLFSACFFQWLSVWRTW